MKHNANEWELYHPGKDANEHADLAAANAAKGNDMKTAWDAWYNSMKTYIHLRPEAGRSRK